MLIRSEEELCLIHLIGESRVNKEIIKAQMPILDRVLKDEVEYEWDHNHMILKSNDPKIAHYTMEILRKHGNRIRKIAAKRMLTDESRRIANEYDRSKQEGGNKL